MEIKEISIEIKKKNEEEVVKWTRPQKIKEGWFNAIIEKLIIKDKNIQFIMRCTFNGLEYIVVSLKPLSKKEIEDININDYKFSGLSYFSKGERK